MTSIIDDARRDLPPASELDARVAALGDAVEILARHGSSEPAVEDAAEVVARASARLRLSADHTVVALAGATGSGKSSTFNALTEMPIAAVGVRRPTTSWATACIWGAQGASELLEWLGIPLRHQVVRDSMLDTGHSKRDLTGLVLLDLPDHDSTEVAHHLEVERLVQLADVLVVILDPQKYADAAVHDRLLRPNVDYAGVMVVVLNHIDEVAADERDRVMSDVRRLLDDDGLRDVPLFATAAATGEGISELHSELARRVADKAASRARTSTDVERAAAGLADHLGTSRRGQVGPDGLAALVTELGGACGLDDEAYRVERTAERAVRRSAIWPPPLALGIRGGVAEAGEPPSQMVVEGCVREAGQAVSAHTGPEWEREIRDTAVAGVPVLTVDLARTADQVLGRAARPAWAFPLALFQWLTFLGAVGAAAWWGFAPHNAGQSRPTWLLYAAVGAVAAGILAMFVGLAAARGAGRHEADRRRREFDEAARSAVVTHVVEPVDRVLAERARAVAAIAQAEG